MSEAVLVKTNPSLGDTVKVIFRMQKLQKASEVAWIVDAFGLRHPDPLEAAKLVHAFTRANVRYKLDPEGKELVRSARESWEARLEGVDCEDLTIFQQSLMHVMGHGHLVWDTIVDLDEAKPGMEHIYPSLLLDGRPRSEFYKGARPLGIAFDSLLRFGEHPKNIIMSLQLYSLGNPGNQAAGWPSYLSGLGRDLTPSEKRKAGWIQHAPAAARRAIAAMMDHVADIRPSGMIVWKPGTKVETIQRIIERHMPQGLGRTRVPGKPKPKKTVLQTVAMIAPNMILGRNAFLLMVRLNAFNLAVHLRLVFMNPEVARKSKLDQAKIAKIMAKRPLIEKKWRALGGDVESLKTAIAAGAHIDPSRLDGLSGEPVSTAATIAAAAPILAVIVPVVASIDWKGVGVDGGNKVENADGTTSQIDGAKLVQGLKAIVEKVTKGKPKDERDMDQAIVDVGNGVTDDTSPAGKPSGPDLKEDKKFPLWAWILLGVATAGGIGFGVYKYSQSSKNNGKRSKSQR